MPAKNHFFAQIMNHMKYIYALLITVSFMAAQAQTQPEKGGIARPDIPGELMVDVGLNFWSSMPGALTRRNWPSKSISFYYVKRKELSSKFSFMYGVGISLEKMHLGDSSTLASSYLPAGDSVVQDVAIVANPFNLSKNKLAINYLDIPFELRFHPMGTEEGEGLFVGVGGIVGIRLKSYTKWKYDQNGETFKEKTTGRFDLKNLRYGYQVRAGFRGVHFFYKRYVSGVFREELAGFEPVMSTFGINVTGF